MRASLLAVLVVTALGTACGRGLTRQQRGVQEQILRERVSAWARHMNNQALDSLSEFYDRTPGLLVAWPDGRRASGWDEQRTYLRDLFREVATLNLVVQDPGVRVLDWGAAVVTYRFSMDLILRSEDRDLFAGYGTALWIRDRENPTWRILVGQHSRTPAGTTGTPGF